MNDKELLGGFEHRVLLAALHLAPEAYTAAIVNELEERTSRSVAPAAVYIALKRLERRGLVWSETRTEASPGERRPRRYFTPTEEAVDLLRNTQRELQSLWRGLAPLLKRG